MVRLAGSKLDWRTKCRWCNASGIVEVRIYTIGEQRLCLNCTDQAIRRAVKYNWSSWWPVITSDHRLSAIDGKRCAIPVPPHTD